jgi:hypothetical protein
MLNGILWQTTLPLSDVGHDISSTSLFIGMGFSPSNRLWGKTSCYIFRTKPSSSKDLISFMVRLVSTLMNQISRTIGLSNAYLHFVPLTQQFMSSTILKVHHGIETTTLSKFRARTPIEVGLVIILVAQDCLVDFCNAKH